MQRECAWTSVARDPWWSRPTSSDPPVRLVDLEGAVVELPGGSVRRVAVELPGVEPGSRGPDDEGATCVGPGCSRTRCSGARQPPRPHHAAMSPQATWSEPFGWILVMSIGPPYEASEGDRRCVSGSEGQVSVLGSCWFPRGINEARVSILGTLPHRRQRPRSRPCQPPGRCIDAVRFSRCASDLAAGTSWRVPGSGDSGRGGDGDRPVAATRVSGGGPSWRAPSPARRRASPSCGACRRRSCRVRPRTRASRARP